MLLSNAPKIFLLCYNYAQSCPIMPKHPCKYNFTVECSIRVFYYIYESSIGVFYLGGNCSIRVLVVKPAYCYNFLLYQIAIRQIKQIYSFSDMIVGGQDLAYYALKIAHYAGIMLNASPYQLCQILCWHNGHRSSLDPQLHCFYQPIVEPYHEQNPILLQFVCQAQ